MKDCADMQAGNMKVQDIRSIIPLEASQLLRPLEELSEEDLESIYYCNLADSQLNCVWY